jgi:hypothetical protein
MSQEVSDMFRAIKEMDSNRKESNRRQFRKILCHVPPCYTIRELTEWHYRITHNGSPIIIDIYPSNKKYHLINSNERGRYRNVITLLKSLHGVKHAT